ncbi:MAG: 16S rRNA (guanine(966)-N(2))-methyltransferase RsmD [Gammaproteobacteria bacterium]
MKNKVRIIGGIWRSRLLDFPPVDGLRPSPQRVRETLFNWLQFEIPGSRCLDLFAGSGALGFEAASRGAGEVVQVERSSEACRYLEKNAHKLSAAAISVVPAEVQAYLAAVAAEPFDIVFLDPPFGQGLVARICPLLERNRWLSESALIYVESEAGLPMDGLPANWSMIKDKTAGEVGYHLFRRGMKQ